MDIVNKLILLLSGQGFILAFLVYRKELTLKNRLISAYILLFSGILVYWYFVFWNNRPIQFVYIYRLDFLFQLFLGPLLFLVVRPRISLRKFLITPTILAAAFLISWGIFTYLVIGRNPAEGPLFSYNIYAVYNYLGLGIVAFYLWRSYSYLQSIVHRLLFACLGVYLIGWLANILMSHVIGYYGLIDYILVFAEIVLFYGTGYYILIQPPRNTAYQINAKDLRLELERITQFMASESPYMSADFNLKQMADHLDLHPKRVSQLINKGFGQSFIDYVNTHRIDRAKEMLINERYRELTVLEILLECGFNSKSAFNSAFKKYTGQSPVQYKKSVITPK